MTTEETERVQEALEAEWLAQGDILDYTNWLQHKLMAAMEKLQHICNWLGLTDIDMDNPCRAETIAMAIRNQQAEREAKVQRLMDAAKPFLRRRIESYMETPDQKCLRAALTALEGE